MTLKLAALGLLALPALAASAQPPTPTTPVRRDSLPPLAPRDLEIRGDLRVSLPSITRPDIAGFGLRSRPVEVDARRAVREAPYVVRGLPESPLAPPSAPDLPAVVLPVARRGTLEAGAGRDLARFGTAFLALPLSRVSRIAGEVAYDGHDARTGRPGSGANAARARLGYHLGTGRTALDVAIHGRGLARGLFGTAPFDGDNADMRTGADGGLSIRVGHAANRASGGALHLGGGLDVRAAAFDPDGTGAGGFGSRDRHLGGAFSLATDALGPATPVGLAVDVRAEGGDTQAGERRRTVTTDAGIALVFGVGPGEAVRAGRVRVGPRVLVADDGERRVAPTLALDARYGFAPGLALLASNTPSVTVGRFADLVFAEPFVAPRTDARATVRPVDARLGLALTRSDAVVTGWLGYRYAAQQGMWRQSAPGALVDVVYGAVSEPAAGLDVRVTPRRVLGSGLVGLRASAEVRSPAFEGDAFAGMDVPGRSRVAAEAGAWGRLGRATLGLTVHGEGERPANVTGGRTLRPWADLDVHASIDIAPAVALVARLDNLAATRRWDGFPESDRLAQIGLSIRW